MNCVYCFHRYSQDVRNERCMEVFYHIARNHPHYMVKSNPAQPWVVRVISRTPQRTPYIWCPKCKGEGFQECICAVLNLRPHSPHGQNLAADEQPEVTRQIRYGIGYRLIRGFAILSGGTHDL